LVPGKVRIWKRGEDSPIALQLELIEVEPGAPNGATKIDSGVYNSEVLLQNLGETLSRFRVGPGTGRDRK